MILVSRQSHHDHTELHPPWNRIRGFYRVCHRFAASLFTSPSMAVDRLPESGADLCSQPTISRLENLPGPVALKRMMAGTRACRESDASHPSNPAEWLACDASDASGANIFIYRGNSGHWADIPMQKGLYRISWGFTRHSRHL